MQILSVIKSEAPNGLLVWKHPAEDFNTLSTLIVNESQVALLYKNGQIADTFTAGRYVLNTQNIPFLRKLIEIPTNGVSTFSCQVYFVNMVEAMNIKWGLSSRVTYMEPTYGIPVELGARGAMSIAAADPRDLVVRLVGSEATLTVEGLVNYFRSLIVMKVKSHLSRTIKEQELNIFELDGQLDVLAEELKERIAPDLKSYGFLLKMFTVEEVLLPEDNPAFLRVRRMLSERSTGLEEARNRAAQAQVAAEQSALTEFTLARGHAAALQVQGTSYREERQLDIAETMAANPGMNQFSGMAANMGMLSGAMAMGVSAAQSMSDAMSPLSNLGSFSPQPTATQPAASAAESVVAPVEAAAPKTRVCQNCGATIAMGAKFCSECGSPQPKFCPNCGAEVSSTAKFCSDCGSRL